MKLKDILQLEDNKQLEYFKYLDIVKPKTSFRYRYKNYKAKRLVKFSFLDVDYIKRLFNDGEFDSILIVFSMVHNIKKESIYNIKFTSFISCLRSIKLELEDLIKQEEKLSFFTTKKVQMALKQSKSEVMNQFGIYNQIDSLSKGDKTKWNHFANMEYSRIKFMLTFDAVGNDFNNRFQENYNKLNKIIK
jgi:hypothetical protein